MGEKQGYTPGPWSVAGINARGDGRIIVAGDYGICSAWDLNGQPENEANARLIAAAPDLLAAAIKSHQPYVGLDEEDIRCLYGADEADLAMALRDAISRATGEDSPANEGEGAS